MGIKRKHLEIALSKLIKNPKPKLKWEGYDLTAKDAAMISHIAQINNDLSGKSVVDLGCGAGILALSAALSGAKFVVGVDIDKDAIDAAKINEKMLGVDVEWIHSDIKCIQGPFDVTLMNPPFGTWRRGMDVSFLKEAIKISRVVYSLHKSGEKNRKFLIEKIKSLGGKVDQIHQFEISLPKSLPFHRKKNYPVKVDLYRVLSCQHERK